MGLLAISIDLDETRCYHAIHGLDAPSGKAATAIYDRAVPRLIRFLDDLGLVSTLFAVGSDLQASPMAASLLRSLAQRGHEIGNHTLSHRYDFASLPPQQMSAEIEAGAELIASLTGIWPRGFRAPGYNINAQALGLLAERGYKYDASVLPCPFYYATRAAAIALKAVRGRISASAFGDPRMLRAPEMPYRTSASDPYSRGRGIPELPITVVSKARIPLVGTFLSLMRPVPAQLVARAAKGLPFVHIELHGMDFADPLKDDLGILAEHQPDLQIPLSKRLLTFERVVKTLQDAGMEAVVLQDAAQRLLI